MPSDQGGCELFEGGIEVASTQPHVVHRQWDEAHSGAVLDGTSRSSIFLELLVFSLADSIIGDFRCVS